MSEVRRKKRDRATPLYLSGGLIGAGLGAAAIGKGIMSDQERGALDRYISAADKWRSGVDPRDAMGGYSVHGSEAAQIKPWGVTLPQFMLGSRKVLKTVEDIKANNPLASPQARAAAKEQASVLATDGSTTAHYQSFVEGPFSGYAKRLEEFYDMPPEDFSKPGNAAAGSVKKVLDRLESKQDFTDKDLQIAGTEYAGATNQAATKLRQDIGELPRPVSEYYGKGNPVLHKLLAKTQEFQKTLPAGVNQSESFKQFDPWLKQQDPSLWKDKQVMDFGGGTIASNIQYPGYMRLGKGVQDQLVTGGLAVAGVGAVGLLGYLLYNNLKKDDT